MRRRKYCGVKNECSVFQQGRGKLAGLLDQADGMSEKQIAEIGEKAKKRVAETYSCEKIQREV